MVRVIYLLSLREPAERGRMMSSLIRDGQWRNVAGKRITDREMVDLANRLQGWTRSVYRFGCAFIHLSNMHDHATKDPFESLSESEKADILSHMRYYHGGPRRDDVTFDDLKPYLPRVFDKITDNLECYLRELETGGTGRRD